MVNRSSAIINEEIRLYNEFRLNHTNELFDPVSISSVEILDTDGITILETIAPAGITRESIGRYYVTTSIDWNNTTRNIFDKWTYIPSLGAVVRTIINNTFVDEILPYQEDFRKGFAYNRPDLLANDGWGSILTPDELRYIFAFGNKLISGTTAETIPDTVLQWYIDNAIQSVEKDLNMKIIKQKVYSKAHIGTKKRDDLDYEAIKLENFIWDEPYDFRFSQFKKYMRIKLNHFPAIEITKILFRDPLGQNLYDFTEWARLNTYTDGSVEIFPNALQLSYIPFFTNDPRYWGLLQKDYYPDAWLIDYIIGFEDVMEFRRMYGELFSIIGKISAMNLLDDYGDGRTSALASSSVSLSGISESFSTTMSATSAMFGARLESYRKELKYWWERNKYKYGNKRVLVGGA